MARKRQSAARLGLRFVVAFVLVLVLAFTGIVAPISRIGVTKVYADAIVESWDALKAAVESGGTQTITLGSDFSYDGTSIVIPNGVDITITGDNTTIYSTDLTSTSSPIYDSMFKVLSGGKLTIDTGVTLSAKMGQSQQVCPDGKEGRPTYTFDMFSGKLNDSSNPTDYVPKGFFIHVEGGGTATLKGTVSDFITSRDKATTPRYVAPIVADGANATFNLDGGTIKNNLVGYIVDDNKANSDAQSIKQYVKGAGPNVPRVPNAATQKANAATFDRVRTKDAGIDDGVPGTGITATAGAIIYKGGAKGTITNGTIVNNRADTGGVMVSGTGTDVKIGAGTEISKNVGVQFGGGSTVEQGGTIQMEDGEMFENVAWFGGGAVYSTQNGVAWLLGLMNGADGLSPQFDERKDGYFEMTGGSLHDNTSLTRGGAILADSNGVHILKGKLENNMSRMLGGAVYVMGDHPLYTYTMHLTGLYVHDNVAVSGLDAARQAATANPNPQQTSGGANLPQYTKLELDDMNSKLQTLLQGPDACAEGGNLFSGTVTGGKFSGNTDDLTDGLGTDGTGGGVWLCAYGNTVFSAGSTDKVVIADNYATGTVPRPNPIYPKWIGDRTKGDIDTNSAGSNATTTGRAGGNDLHADTGDSGMLTIKDLHDYSGWIDENASTNSDVPYITEVSDRRVNIINKGSITTMDPAIVMVEVSGNIARRGGGLAADGTFMLGMSNDQASVEASMGVTKSWTPTAERYPVVLRVNAIDSNGKTAVVADVPLDGEANAPATEFDTIEELAPTGSTWNGRFSLPLELDAEGGGSIRVFEFVVSADYPENGDPEQTIDPLTTDGRDLLARVIRKVRENNTTGDTFNEEAAIEELKRAVTMKFKNDLVFSLVEMEDDGSGNLVPSTKYVFTQDKLRFDANSVEFDYEITTTPFYGKKINPDTGEIEDAEAFQVHLMGINISLAATNDNQPLTEKYVNKDVHSDIVNFDQDFEYDIMAYVPLTAEEFTISDTLVNGLEFAGPAGNPNNIPSQVVRSIAVKTLNNHEPGENGTVSGPGEPGRNGKPINLMPDQNQVLPSGITIHVNTQLNISGNTLTVRVPAGDTLNFLKGKWIQVTFGARINDKYRSLDALKGLSANVDDKDKSWEGTGTDKKGSPLSSYLVANGDKAIVAPILAEVGPDPVIWAVEAPSRLFARTANGDYYATPMNDKSGSTWRRLDKDLDNGDDRGYGKPVWINADNRYNGRAPHAANTRRQIALDEALLDNLKAMPLIVGSTITKAAEGATRYFAEVKDADAEGNTHIWATDKGELDSLTWHEVTDTTSNEYTNAVARLSNDRYTIRMLDLVRDTITLDPNPDTDTGKNWPVISDEIHEGMANQAKYSVKFGNNAEAKTYKTNTVTVAPETTELEIKKVWDVNGKDEWPAEVNNVTFAIWSVKNGTETPLKGTIGTSGTSDGVFTPSGDPNATQATYVLTKEKKNVTITGLPNLKNTTYIAREIKINDVDVTYNSDKTLGRVITADVKAFVSMEDKQKEARFQKADDAISEELLVGAEAEDRLWVMTASGKYYVTEVGDTEGTADTTTWTQVAVPNNNSPADVVELYTRAEEILGSVDAQGRQTLGTDETVTTVNLTKIFTATNTKPQTEKYVNNDVHAELVEFDKAFKYDIMVFVPMGSTELTITDPLGSALEFAKAKDSLDAADQSKAEKAKTAAETISSVVYKAKNDHKADSTVSGKDEGNPGKEIVATGYTADIANNTLTIKFVGADDTANPGNKLPLDFAGNWVQVTFWAKYTDTIIEAANIGDIEKIRNNGAVVSGRYPSVAMDAPPDKFSHEGTKNAASAEIKVDNASTFKLDTNEVTVKPETTKISVQKKLLDLEGAEVTEWPAGLVVKVNVLKNVAGSAEEPEVIHEFSITDFEKHSTGDLPRLVGVTYTVSEGEITGDYAFHEMTGGGTDASPFVITNKEQKFVDVEITKKWQGATMDEIPSGVDFKTFLVLKNGADEDVSEAFAGNLDVTVNGTTYIAKWTKLPDDTYTVEEKPIPGFETVREGDVITNTKKPEEEKPEIEKYVNQAVHKEIKLEEVFTYDVIAYVTKDADSVTITDTLNDMLAFEGDASSVEVVDLGEANNHFVTNNIYAEKVNENATVSKTGEKIDAAVVEINDKTLTVSITNILKKIDSKYISVEIEPITSGLPPEPTYTAVEIETVNPAEKGWYERTGAAEPYTYAPTADTTVNAEKTYYQQIETYEQVTPDAENPADEGWYERTGDAEPYTYTLTEDTTVDAEKTYYKQIVTYEQVTPDAENPAEKGWYERTGDTEPYTYTLTEDTTVDPTKTYYEKVEESDPGTTTVEQINPSELGYFEKIEEDGAEKYVLTEDTVPADGKTYYVEEALEGYEYDGDVQPVTALRGHWIKITFNAKIDGKTLEEVKVAYKDIPHIDVDENRDTENVGNAPVISVEDHTGIPNDASYTIGVANEFGIQEDVHRDSSNVVTVKPKEYNEKPEIEKYVNQAVHKDIKIDEVFTYDIIAFVTKDADSVVIRDTLLKNLVFATDSDAVLVEDIGVENNHKVTNSISATKVNDDATVAKAGEPVTPSEVTMLDGKELIVEIPDAKAYRGHWIRVRFDVRIEAGKKVADVEADYDTVKASEIYADSISGGERALPNVGNEPVASEEDHTGLPNTASYEITVDNAVRYEDTSNTVTVKPKEEEPEPTPEPETVEVSVEKVWDEKYSGIDKRPTSVTINLLKNGELADSMVLTEETGWKGTFSNLDKKDAAGNEIAYTVEEVAVEYYYYDVLWLDKTYVVTNHRRPWIPNLPSTPGNIGEVKIYKTVSGIAEKDKSYDIQVKFTYKDGSTYTHELSLKPGDEPFLFDYVPVGTKVEVSEITTGYDMTCKVDGTDATNFTVEIGKTHEVAINNDKKPEEPKPEKPDKAVPTGDSNNARAWILLFGVTALLALALAARRKA